ncbi:related to ATP synthase assembly factor FMC1, mitochondrial [Nakaseomyces glabratus]|nr:related to ATP synthase assembly factor FMC1, mitochondrial [Nakaseomyces glabratus]SLM10996.1 related to ATP synthase assembly factor FMC1, mitochondrial [Nakaseomyces glabratus]
MSAAHTYRAVVRSIVKFERPNVLQQLAKKQKEDIAKLTYRRIQVVRDQMTHKSDPVKLKELNKEAILLGAQVEKLKKWDLREINVHIVMSSLQDTRSKSHLMNIEMFLTNQREYEELIERYNPGKKLSQDEKVKRTANKVGLEIPPDLV